MAKSENKKVILTDLERRINEKRAQLHQAELSGYQDAVKQYREELKTLCAKKARK